MSVNVLKLEVSMPNAHFRVIHSSNPQKTHPLPPYSTVIGFLANILGNQEQINAMLKGELALGVLSHHDYITREYTWLRNVLRSAHTGRYGSTNNRSWQEVDEHIGGQSPVSIEVLNDVHLVLYVYHANPDWLDKLVKNINAPEKWYSHLHLGRAEDWVTVDSVSMVSLSVSNKPADLRNANQYFQWMPEPASSFGLGTYVDEKHYKELYQKVQGPAALVTSIYKLVKVPYQEKKGKKIEIKSETIRNFEHVPVRSFSSPIPFLSDFTLPAVFADVGLNAPVFMANITGNNKGRGGDNHAK